MRKSIMIIALLIGILAICQDLAYTQEDAGAGLLQTGMFHGQVALRGMKEMIYYFEKAVGMEAGEKEGHFQKHAREALKQAREAYKLFQESIGHAEASLKTNSDKKEE